MKFKNPLLAVKDMERSKMFYREVLGLRVVSDFGANVTLTGGVALQTEESWLEFIGRPADYACGSYSTELYFEEDDFDAFVKHLSKKKMWNTFIPRRSTDGARGSCGFAIRTDTLSRWESR